MARNNSEVEVIFKAQNKDFNDAEGHESGN